LSAGEKCQVMYPLFYIFDSGDGNKRMINFVINTPTLANSITINDKRTHIKSKTSASKDLIKDDNSEENISPGMIPFYPSSNLMNEMPSLQLSHVEENSTFFFEPLSLLNMFVKSDWQFSVSNILQILNRNIESFPSSPEANNAFVCGNWFNIDWDINISSYVRRLHRHNIISPECFVLAAIYIEYMMHSKRAIFNNTKSVAVVFIVATMIAHKMHDDLGLVNNRTFANALNIPVSILNLLELRFLYLMGFHLHISPKFYYAYESTFVATITCTSYALNRDQNHLSH
jgi:hypothetical protein